MNAETIATALGGAKRSGNGWQAKCPAHVDDNPSLSLSDGEGARVLVYWHGGCPQDVVIGELRKRGLWPTDGEWVKRPTARKKADWRPLVPVPSDAPQPMFSHFSLGRPSSVWIYRDNSARTLAYVARFDTAGGKEVLPYTYCQSAEGRREWRWKGFPEPRPLYNLDKLAHRPDDWVLIVEGEKTADAVHKLFPDHVATTSAGGSNAASAADWSPLKGRKAAIWPDADEPGRKYADAVAELARKAGAEKAIIVAVPSDFPSAWDLADSPPPGWDQASLRKLLDDAAFGENLALPDFETVLDRAAALDPISYDRQRSELAKELGVRAKTLDDEVSKRRADGKESKKLFLVEPPAWEEPVDGAVLLDDIVAELKKYLVLPRYAPEAIALWIMHAHALDAFQISPILAMLSPEKRCAKTTTLTIIYNLLPRPVFASNVSPASIFRLIQEFNATLLIDEFDTFVQQNDELRGIINSGHQRNAAYVLRVNGDELQPKLFLTWAPKVLAMIGKLPSTLSDRAIEVPLKRKRPEEKVMRFRLVRPGNLPDLRRQCIRWSADNLITLREGALGVSVPDGLNDRAADNWEPLLAIADRAGGEWPEWARKAALALSGDGVVEDDSAGVMLLGDIKTIFEQRALDAETNPNWNEISSKQLAEAFAVMEGRPWPEWRGGKPISSHTVARLLKPFGIEPGHVGARKKDRGYAVNMFEEAFARYITPSATAATAATLKTKENSEKQSAANDPGAALSNHGKDNEINAAAVAALDSPLQSARAMMASMWTSLLGKSSYEPPKHNPDRPPSEQPQHPGRVDENGDRAERAASGIPAPPRAKA